MWAELKPVFPGVPPGGPQQQAWDGPETLCHPQNQSSHLQATCCTVSRSGFLKGLSSNFGLSCIHTSKKYTHLDIWASLVVQWLRILLPMQGTWVQSLVQEDPTCCGATKPACCNYWARVLQLLSPRSRAHAPNKRSHRNEKPAAPQQRVAPARRN